MKNAICLVAGKSGGHILPALTIANTYKKDTQIIFISTSTAIDIKILKQESIVDQHIPLKLGNVPQKKWWLLPMYCLTFSKTMLHAFNILRKRKPKKIITTGSYIALPVCFAGFVLRIPIEVYELNASPGKATKLLSSLAHKIFVCFEEALHFFPLKKTSITNYPLTLKNTTPLKIASNKRKTIFVLGGSQGSKTLNRLITTWLTLNAHVHTTIQIIHQTGEANIKKHKEFYKKNNISANVFDFASNIHQHYAQADIIICRSGAGTLFEIAHHKKHCITIPLKTSTTSHQHDNAKAMAKKHTNFMVILENRFDLQLEKMHEFLAKKLNLSQ